MFGVLRRPLGPTVQFGALSFCTTCKTQIEALTANLDIRFRKYYMKKPVHNKTLHYRHAQI